MTFPVTHRLAALPRLGAAALLAVTALVGTTTGALGDPATACAAPPGGGFDGAGYDTCTDIAWDQYERGEITKAEFFQAEFQCCYDNGGEWDFTSDLCVDPADEDSPAQLPRFPDLGEPTATLTPAPPPAGPIAPSVPPAQTG